MKKRLLMAVTAILIAIAMMAGSAYAFSDTSGDPNEDHINALQQAGIVSGVNEQMFAPKGKVTMAQGITMLVKAFDLNIDRLRFIKEPKASDYFTKVADDAWYATSFMYAHLNGVPIPKDVDPSQSMTKEQFADLLFHALSTKGDYAFVEMYVAIKDEDQINKDYMNSIQKLLLGKMTELHDGYFYPKQEITRSEAARMLHAAIQFAKQHKPVPVKSDVTLSVTKVNDEVNKVTLTWAERPNPGYGISVSAIAFTEDGKAIITYVMHEPAPGKMYPQVITEAKVDTFIASSYEPVLNSPD
ncbi:S-layer homology domain-containing protein [Paenibacillus ginsengarvi]|uniref:SLH domain-containing protein n=1 Tax=Paenibacillus ginsengarvi TaxID=400777 RepID=A0A3B0CSI5_9BACL|nr:S-layer homology domain-containing protein [Paenibacillus ginsengarvi]RKN86801.1 hypothetical protein D7M11_02260 [Paenibacillus ginsengarvi]